MCGFDISIPLDAKCLALFKNGLGIDSDLPIKTMIEQIWLFSNQMLCIGIDRMYTRNMFLFKLAVWVLYSTLK